MDAENPSTSSPIETNQFDKCKPFLFECNKKPEGKLPNTPASSFIIGNSSPRELTDADQEQLRLQDVRGLLPEFQRKKLEQQASANWDKFYKRNETRFFKDRHWTTREFTELLGLTVVQNSTSTSASNDQRSLLEIGCGVGNLLYPLLEAGLKLRVFACDFSPRAIDFVKKHELYNPDTVTAFVADLTQASCLSPHIPSSGMDLVTCIFVLSAISPEQHHTVARNVASACRPGSVLLFRDYAVNDLAMVRFAPGSKIANRFYVRQDGTRAYYFTTSELEQVFTPVGFVCMDKQYIHSRVRNHKEGVDVPRVFLQAKFIYQPQHQH